MKMKRWIAIGLVAAFGSACASTGTRTGPHPGICGAIGALAGGGAGAWIAADMHKAHDANEAVAGGAIGAAAGLVVGSLLCYALQGEAEEPAPAPPPAPAPKPAPERIVLRGVNFDFDKATIRPDARVILDEAASLLAKNAGTRVSVEGHTDAVGSDAYNQKLSDRRAAAVVQYLTGKGVPAGSLSAKGFGESKPVSSNETKDGRAMNRRVELRVQ